MADFKGWQPDKKRWVKKINGKMKSRSAKQLAKEYPDLVSALTREGTIKAARKHFAKVRLEMDAEFVPRTPYEMHIARKEQWFNSFGTEEMKSTNNVPIDWSANNAMWAERFAQLDQVEEQGGTVAERVDQFVETQKNRIGKDGKKGLTLSTWKKKQRFINFTKDIIGKNQSQQLMKKQ